jgi:hypothetical protein
LCLLVLLAVLLVLRVAVQIHAMYALLAEYKIKVPDVDRAGYASLDPAYQNLKQLKEEVDSGKEQAISKYSTDLVAGKQLCWPVRSRQLSVCMQTFTLHATTGCPAHSFVSCAPYCWLHLFMLQPSMLQLPWWLLLWPQQL